MPDKLRSGEEVSPRRSLFSSSYDLPISFLRAVVVGALAIGLTLMAAPRAQAQDPPDSPTAVAVYTVVSDDPNVSDGDELNVRWSASDTTVTGFKVQWKSGTEDYASSRQDEVTASSALEEDSSPGTTKRYTHTIDDLTDGTEYTVRVIATNAHGDSDPSSEMTGTPDGRLRLSALAFFQNEVVNPYASDYPWLQQVLDYLVAAGARVEFEFGPAGGAGNQCSGSPADGLQLCTGWYLGVGQHSDRMIKVAVHEMAHIFTLSNKVTTAPAPVAAAHLYVHSLGLPMYVGSSGRTEIFPCSPEELYADVVTMVVLGRLPVTSSYWESCPGITDEITTEAIGVGRSAVAGTMPSWFATYYDDGDGELDLERVWADIKAVVPAGNRVNLGRIAMVYQLKDAFGGYCDNPKANNSAFRGGATRNPWMDGGCTPDAPGSVAATASGSGKLTVTWSAPTYDGGSPITGYRVEWKSGAEEFDTSRQASVNNPLGRQHQISGLTDGVTYTVRVLAVNHHGDGDPSSETTATTAATDTTAPTLLGARVDGATLTLEWSESLDSSGPATNDFAVSVAGSSRGVTDVSMGRSSVTLTLASAAGVGETVTVTYTVPTGTGANPIRDAARNDAEGLSSQTARNHTTAVTVTSDPGTDMTYSVRDEYRRQDVIEFTVTFGETVKVAGVPELDVEVAGSTRKARYASGSGTTALTFRYTVAADDLDEDGVSVPSGEIDRSQGDDPVLLRPGLGAGPRGDEPAGRAQGG